ncbi:hypothetical protein DIPPA_00583 [Diplonema papillatum]|nr:hypothetical protein DIPPA_00583 [Diplonema papillatum]
MSDRASHNKAVDTPQLHRSLRPFGSEHTSPNRAQEANFHIGEEVHHMEPQWSASQRYANKRTDHSDILAHNAACESQPVGKPVGKQVFDQTANMDWTGDTGSTVQKVLPNMESHFQSSATVVRSRGDGWASTSCSKTIENSPGRKSIEREPKIIPNEKTLKPRDPHHSVLGWNTESMKTLEPEAKRELNLAPPPVPAETPKPLRREEDWDSNLKTLPNCSKTGQRRPHTYEDIKDSVVTQPRSGKRMF